MLTITYFESNDTHRTLTYNKSSVMIGRAPGNDLCLEEVKGVSRYHARVYLEGDQLIVQDLNSTNGTYVNKVKVQSSAIGPRDTIMVGDASFRVVYEDCAAESEELLLIEEPSVEQLQESLVMPDGEMPLLEEIEGSQDLASDHYWTSLSNFLNPVWPYVLDETVREIVINGPKEIYFDRGGRLYKSDRMFTEAELRAALQSISQYSGRRPQDNEAFFDARLPDGSRVTVILPPYSMKGISMNIRKFSRETLDADRWLQLGSVSKEILVFLKACVALKKNILIAGPAASGRTSLLNILGGYIPAAERVVTVEEFAELELRRENVLAIEARPRDQRGGGKPPFDEIFRVAMRMRPDRVILGELRGSEALDFLQAMSGGQPGSMATVHALTPLQALRRTEALAYSTDETHFQRAIREKVCDSIDLVVQTSRLPDQSRKITQVSELRGLSDRGEYSIVDVFRYDRVESANGANGSWRRTDYTPEVVEEIRAAGLIDALALFA